MHISLEKQVCKAEHQQLAVIRDLQPFFRGQQLSQKDSFVYITKTHFHTPKAHQWLSVGPGHGEWLLKSQLCLLLLTIESVALEKRSAESCSIFLLHLLTFLTLCLGKLITGSAKGGFEFRQFVAFPVPSFEYGLGSGKISGLSVVQDQKEKFFKTELQ